MVSSDWISLGAAVVALFALGLSIAEATANRPRLRLGHSFGYGVGLLDGHWIIVSVINWGRQPTTITSVSIEFPGLKGADGSPKHMPHIQPSQNGIALGDKASRFLEVGQEAQFYFFYPAPGEVLEVAEEETLRGLAKKYGAAIRISSSWHRKPLRRLILKADD